MVHSSASWGTHSMCPVNSDSPCPCDLCYVCTPLPRSVYISCLAAFAVELLPAMMAFFQDTSGVGGGGGLFRYQRLERRDDGAAALAPRSRWRWLRAALANNGKAASSSSPCMFHAKKLKWSRIASSLVPRKKVAEFSAKIRSAGGGGATAEDDGCPTVVIFMSPWGLPVLSRPLLAGHKGSRYQYHHGRDAF